MNLARRAISGAIGKTFLVSILGKFALIAMTALLGRVLGPTDFGVFIFAQGTAVLVAQFAVLGWPTYSMRTLPSFLAGGDFGHYRGFLQMSLGVVFVSTVLFSAGLLVFGRILTSSSRPALAAGLFLAAFVLPTISFRRLVRQQLAAVRKPGMGVLVDEVIPPLGVILVLLIIVPSSYRAVVVYGAAGAIACLVGYVLLARYVSATIPPAGKRYDFRSWFVAAFHCLVGLSSRMLLNRTDVVLLAPLATMAETGLYGAAFRLTYLLTFPQIVLSMVMSPRYSAAYSRGDMAALQKLLRYSYAFTLISTGVCVLPLLLAPGTIMELVYGPEFREGGTVLLLLSLSQLAAAIGLPTVSVAMMTDRQKMVGISTLVVALINVALNIVLIPVWGAEGAAVASLACMAGLALIQIPWITLSLRRSARNATGP